VRKYTILSQVILLLTSLAGEVLAQDGHSLDASDGDPIDAVYVDAGGKVGIGTLTPTQALTVLWYDRIAPRRFQVSRWKHTGDRGERCLRPCGRGSHRNVSQSNDQPKQGCPETRRLPRGRPIV
jgi:hypothetical protein